MTALDVLVLDSAEDVARHAARHIAHVAALAIAARGRFVFAVSGGSTPEHMLHELAQLPVSWQHVYVCQVDERVAPHGDAARNLTQLSRAFLSRVPTPLAGVLPMPVEQDDLGVACTAYADALRAIADDPPVLDLVHLGLGADGHTASLLPGDTATLGADADVAVSIPYNGHVRMTMTAPLINRARHVMWVVTGAEKRAALSQLLAGDAEIPGSLIRTDRALVIADLAAGRGDK